MPRGRSGRAGRAGSPPPPAPPAHGRGRPVIVIGAASAGLGAGAARSGAARRGWRPRRGRTAAMRRGASCGTASADASAAPEPFPYGSVLGSTRLGRRSAASILRSHWSSTASRLISCASSSGRIACTRCLHRLSFVSPAGLADGLALKELRYATAAIRPRPCGHLGPPCPAGWADFGLMDAGMLAAQRRRRTEKPAHRAPFRRPAPATGRPPLERRAPRPPRPRPRSSPPACGPRRVPPRSIAFRTRSRSSPRARPGPGP